ncbi:hypothetical protein Taro_007307 [Colocasia esculenta]|uniref:RNase H type-1 domain-containing protein n=1 Tax=Colocasia esculenta TaxID=4460 RepID=A0A843U3G7_COLES|nr:hypothetical protein [Colocasia esculenta]
MAVITFGHRKLKLHRGALTLWSAKGGGVKNPSSPHRRITRSHLLQAEVPKLIRWIPPQYGFSMNVDGACKGNPGPCGGGGCIRDTNGEIHLGFTFYYGQGNTMLAEVRVPYDGLRLADYHGLPISIVHSDSLALALLVHLFYKSLEGESLSWFISLPATDLVNFDILSERFVAHFKLENSVTTLPDLAAEKMRPDESFVQFANRTRSVLFSTQFLIVCLSFKNRGNPFIPAGSIYLLFKQSTFKGNFGYFVICVGFGVKGHTITISAPHTPFSREIHTGHENFILVSVKLNFFLYA